MFTLKYHVLNCHRDAIVRENSQITALTQLSKSAYLIHMEKLSGIIT